MRAWLKRIGLFIAGTILGMAGIVDFVTPGKPSPSAPAAYSFDAGPTIEQIQVLSSLVTSRVQVSDVVITRLDGYTGGVEAAVLLRGDFELGVDLSAAKFESVDPTARTAVLVLPKPTVSQPRVDFERSRLVAVQDKGLWKVVPGTDAQTAVTNRAFKDAQKFVEQSADDAALKERAKRQAEMVLGAFFRTIKWTVGMRWTDG